MNNVADNKFITYFLDKINYKIFKCNKLLYDFDNLKSNFAFYTILGSLFVILFLNILYIYEISKVKKLLINKEKISNKKKPNKSPKKKNLPNKLLLIKKHKNNPVKKKRNKTNKKNIKNTK